MQLVSNLGFYSLYILHLLSSLVGMYEFTLKTCLAIYTQVFLPIIHWVWLVCCHTNNVWVLSTWYWRDPTTAVINNQSPQKNDWFFIVATAGMQQLQFSVNIQLPTSTKYFNFIYYSTKWLQLRQFISLVWALFPNGICRCGNSLRSDHFTFGLRIGIPREKGWNSSFSSHWISFVSQSRSRHSEESSIERCTFESS